jgi:hypothetical protein
MPITPERTLVYPSRHKDQKSSKVPVLIGIYAVIFLVTATSNFYIGD